MSYKLKPITRYAMVKLDEDPAITEGGIHIPDQAQKRTHIGEVLETGPGYVNEHGHFVESPVKAGDRVVIKGHGYKDVQFEGETYCFVPHENIFCTVEEG